MDNVDKGMTGNNIADERHTSIDRSIDRSIDGYTDDVADDGDGDADA